MKKVWIISGIVLGLVAISFVGIYALVDNWFPKAGIIVCPDDGDVILISLTFNEVAIEMDEERYKDVLEVIRDVKPTKRMSVNDVPSTNTYYILAIATATKNYRYFVYFDYSMFFITNTKRADDVYLLALYIAFSNSWVCRRRNIFCRLIR